MYKRQDLYECLRAQQEEQAQELATALELYVVGSLNYLPQTADVIAGHTVITERNIEIRAPIKCSWNG